MEELYIICGGILVLAAVGALLMRANNKRLERTISGQVQPSRWQRHEYSAPASEGSAPPTPAPGTSTEVWKPTYQATVEGQVLVPLFQALITSALITLGAGVTAYALARDYWLSITGAIAVGALILSWFARMGIFTEMLQTVERSTGVDINRDGAIGRQPHGVLINPDEARQGIEDILRNSRRAEAQDKLWRFWLSCKNSGTSEQAQGIKPNTAGRDAYIANRDALMRLGLAAWNNADRPNAGWSLTTDGETARQIIAAHVTEI